MNKLGNKLNMCRINHSTTLVDSINFGVWNNDFPRSQQNSMLVRFINVCGGTLHCSKLHQRRTHRCQWNTTGSTKFWITLKINFNSMAKQIRFFNYFDYLLSLLWIVGRCLKYVNIDTASMTTQCFRIDNEFLLWKCNVQCRWVLSNISGVKIIHDFVPSAEKVTSIFPFYDDAPPSLLR